MNGREQVVVILLLAIVAMAGITTAVLGLGPISGVVSSEDPHPPALLSFESAGAQCTDDFIANSSTRVSSGGSNTHLTHAQNISLPDPSYAVGGPTFERRNDTTYVLSIPTEETEKESLGCTGFARYKATMRIPAGDGPWRIIVRHDDETAITLFGNSDGTGTGGSASAGGERPTKEGYVQSWATAGATSHRLASQAPKDQGQFGRGANSDRTRATGRKLDLVEVLRPGPDAV